MFFSREKKCGTNAQSFCPYTSLQLNLKDLNGPISHLVLKYCKFISESGRCLNNQDTSITGLITDTEKLKVCTSRSKTKCICLFATK